MNSIVNILKFQDVFRITFKYFFNKKRIQHTIITVLISLGINSFVISLFILEIFDLIKHKSPRVNYAKIRQTISPNFTLNSDELIFSIGIRDKNYNFINDPSIAYIKATYEVTKSNDGKINQEINNLQYMNCLNIKNIYEKKGIVNYFDSNSVIDYSCYNFTSPIIIGGQYSTSFYGNLAFYIIKCQNGTQEGIICKSEEEINNLLQDGWLQIIYFTSYVDYYNYSKPIQYIATGPFSKLDISINKITYIYFSQIQTETDNGWIIPSISNIYSTELDYIENDISKVKNDGIIASIYVCPSPSLEVFFRKYQKIQEIAASIGGTFSAFNLFFSIILRYFAKYQFDVFFANSLFLLSFENPFKKNFIFNRNVSNTYKNIQKSNINKKFNLNIINNDDEIKKDYNPQSSSRKIVKIKEKPIYEMNLNLKNLFRLALDKITKNGKTIKKEYYIIKYHIMNYSDFINIGRNIIDVEKIKKSLIEHFPRENSLTINKKLLNLNYNNEIYRRKSLINKKYSNNQFSENLKMIKK